ncbi:hypothetical protein F0L17_20475 [Streptomyces sp. TRM43335]|uniref:Lipoprotein n=1 Tax=Streptomyces taklimakanensis TaxID=2569853 RepID=A0A6G2BHA4_9ACTN|nr:hypothetical protein [Streptomyces taklimakanensis]MTE21443.1 hypothetical protein [Streptomyces taklimakanensis]
MRATAIRRTAVAACAVSLALLATACGGSESDGGGEEKAKADTTASAEPASEVKTAAELEKLVLADGDVDGHKVEELGPGDSTPAESVSADKKECELLAYAQLGVPIGDPAATVQRMVTQEPQKPAETGSQSDGELTEEDLENFENAMNSALDVTATVVSLSSYEDGGARKAVADLRAAAEACSGGFTGGVKGEEQKVIGVEEGKVTGGDEAFAWTVTAEAEGEPAPFKLAVVRKGGTLATFSSFNMLGVGKGEDYEQPTEVIDAQAKKLG